jgi:hypothetical protein
MSLLLALNVHASVVAACLFFGEERTSRGQVAMSASDPFETFEHASHFLTDDVLLT